MYMYLFINNADNIVNIITSNCKQIMINSSVLLYNHFHDWEKTKIVLDDKNSLDTITQSTCIR